MSSLTSAAALSISYDRDSDVLYVSTRADVPALSEEEKPGLLWRYDPESGDLIGVTIVDFGTFWSRRRSELIADFASRFQMSPEEARRALDSAVA
jgi:hypothetical protein